MVDSGVLCTHPVNYNSYYTGPTSIADYTCEEAELPISPPEWDSKWYSPVCRDWFKDQKANPTHGTLSDVYMFAQGDLGITQCSPIVKQDSEASEADFFGALCLDLNAVEMNEVFSKVDEEAKSQLILFNPDEVYE